MAISRTPNYVSEQQFAYYYAKNKRLFDEDAYNTFNAESPEMATDYALATANIKDIPDTFDYSGYNLLGAEDKYSMILNEFYQDKTETTIDKKTGTSYNVYEKNKEYFNQQIDRALEQKTYEGLNDFEKGLNTVGGIVGNVLNEVFLGTIEGIFDLAGLITGNTAFVAKDITGYSAIKEDLNKYARAYTNINKDFLSTLVNDVITGIGKMSPMLIPGVGVGIYFGAMAGNVAEQTLQSNPDIDYASLLGYTAATTTLEIATEKLFGDVVFKKGLFNIGYGGIASKNIYTRLAADFVTEGFEEMAAEIGNSILYKTMIDPNAPISSISDILYAGLIGGIIGGVMSGGAIATTSRIKIGDKELSKFDSLAIMENLNALKQDSTKDAVLDLAVKNLKQGESTQQAIERLSKDPKYSAEYNKAIESNAKRDKTLVKSTLALANVYNKIGAEQFQKSLKLLDYDYETRAKDIRNYTQSLQQKQNIKVQELTKRFKVLYPNESIAVSEVLTPEQERYKQSLYKQYKKDIVFVDFGSKEAQGEYHAFVMDENTIFINNEILKTMSPTDILNNIVKEELVHSLQRNGEILSNENIDFLNKYYLKRTGEALDIKKLNEAYSKESKLVKKSEKQAKALAQALLFDDLTINDVLMMNKGLFSKTYKWLKNIAKNIFTSDQKGKIKYNTIHKIMRKYRKTISNNIGNVADLDEISKRLDLNDKEKEEIKNAYKPTFSKEHFVLMKVDINYENKQKIDCMHELESNRQFINRLLPFSFRNAFNEEYYEKAFVDKIKSLMPNEKFFKSALQNYLIGKYNFVISQPNNCLLSFVDLNYLLDDKLRELIQESVTLRQISKYLKNYKGDIREIEDINKRYSEKRNILRTQYGSVDKLFKNNNSLSSFAKNIPIVFIVDENDQAAGWYDDKIKEIYINFAKFEDEHTIIHEITHALADIQGLPLGGSPDSIKRLLTTLNEKEISFLADNLLESTWIDAVNRFGWDRSRDLILDNLSYAIYELLEGEQNAELYKKNESSFSNISGFILERGGTALIGYGRFKKVLLLPTEESINASFNYENVFLKLIKSKRDVVTFAKSKKQTNLEKELKTMDLKDYDPKLVETVAKDKIGINSLKKIIIETKDEKTSDLLIKLVYPENKNVTNYKQLEEMENYVKGYMFGLKEINKNTDRLKTTILNNDMEITSKNAAIIYKKLDDLNKLDSKIISENVGVEGEETGFSITDVKQFEEYTEEDEYDRLSKEEEQRKIVEKLIAFKKDINKKLKLRYTKNKNKEDTTKIDDSIINHKFAKVFGIENYQELLYKNEDFIIDTYGEKTFNALRSGIPKELELSKLRAIEETTLLYEFQQKINDITKELETTKESITEENAEVKKIEINKIKNKAVNLLKALEKDKEIIIENFNEEIYQKLVDKIPKELLEVEEKLNLGSTLERKALRAAINRYKKTLAEKDPENELLKINLYKIPIVELAEIKAKLLEEIEKMPENITTEAVLETKDEVIPVEEKQEIVETKEEIVEEKKPPVEKTEKLTRILDTKYDTFRMSEVQKVGEEINKESAVINIREFLYKNEKDLEALEEQEASEMLDSLLNGLPFTSTEVNEVRIETSNRLMLAMYIKENESRFSKDTIAKAEKYAKQELSLSGTQLGVWSSLFEQANPIETAIEKFKLNFGKALKISPEKIKRYKKALRERDYAKQTELEEEFIIEVGKQLPEGRFNWTKGTFEERQLAFKRFMGKMNGFRYFAMLTNISTHVQNIISNFMIRKLDDLDNKLISFFEKFGDFDKYKQLKYIGEGKTNPLILDYVNNQFGDLFDIIVKVGKYEIVKKEDLLEQAEFKNQYKNKLLQKLSNLVFDSLSKMDRVFSRPVIAEKMARLIQANNMLSNEILEMYKSLADNKITRIRKVKDDIIGSIHSNKLNLDFNFKVSKEGVKIDQEISYENITKNDLDSEISKLENILKENKDLISKAIKDNPLKEDLTFELIENAANRTLLEFLRKPNAFSVWWNNIMDKHWSLKILMSAILPFPTVVSNITIQVFQHSPINLVRGIARKISESKNGKWYSTKNKKWAPIEDVLAEDIFFMSKTNEMLAKGSSGTALMLVGIILAAMGLIGFDEDDEYAGIVFDFAGYKVKLAGLAPAISPLLIGAALIHSEAYPDLTGRLKKIVNDLSILGTFDDLFGYGQDLFTIPFNGLSNYFVQFVPAILRSFSKVIESEKKVDYSNWFTKTIGRILSGIPIVKEILPNKVNPYTGEPIMAYGSGFLAFLNMLTPIKLSKDIDDYISNETKMLGVSTTGANGTFSINGSDISLDGKALENFQTFRAKAVNTLLTNLIDDIKKYRVQKEDGTYETLLYSEMSDDQKKNVIKSVYTTATEYSKINYWINSGNTYVVTNYDKLAEYKEFITDPSGLIYKSKHSGSKYIKK